MIHRCHRISVVVVSLLLAGGCASPPVDLAETRQVPMNKVYPYPTDQERAQAISKLTIKATSSADLGDARADQALAEIDRHFSNLLRANGARVTDTDPDYTLEAELSSYRYVSSWKRPLNWRLQSDEAMAETPGTCTHRVETQLVLSVTGKPDAPALQTFTLDREAEAETKSVDDECPFTPAAREALLLTALRESLPCVRIQLVNFFAPRGYLIERRSPVEGGYDIFRSTLTRSQLPADTSSVEIYRVQLSTSGDGRRLRSELRIAEGRLAKAVDGDDEVWLEIDVSGAQQELLDGDIVRPVVSESGMSSLTPWGSCGRTLAES